MSELNQKPCSQCRRRKVRCDKHTPCANCMKSKTRCLYEDHSNGENMGPLVLDKPATVHLFDRLAGLERMVERLCELNLQPNSHTMEMGDAPAQSNTANDGVAGEALFPFTLSRDLSEPHGQVFLSLEESNSLIQLFLKVNEPFIRMLHVPLFLQQLAEYRSGQVPADWEVMLPPIHALALATLSSGFVLDFFRRPRGEILVIFRKQAEGALAKADFLRTHKPIVLRSLLYFITFLFEVEDNEYASSLVGVAFQIALRIRLEHDYEDSTPFMRDARRRLWLHLRYLDNRAANLLDIDTNIRTEWDTPLPTNTFDETWESYRIAPETFNGDPPNLTGWSDMSFVLARTAIEEIQAQTRTSGLQLKPMEKYMNQQKQEIRRDYLSDGSTPLQKFMGGLLQIHLGAAYLTARSAYHKHSTEDFRNQTFITAIELLEQISALEAEMEYKQWLWVLRSFVPIRAIVTVLTCTLFKSNLECEDRAWQQIDKVYARYDNADCHLVKTSIFEPTNELREQALEVKRQRELLMQAQ